MKNIKNAFIAVILGCFILSLSAQDKVPFEGTIQIHKQQESILLQQSQEELKQTLQKQASSKKDFGDKMIAKAVTKSVLKENDRLLKLSGGFGEFDIFRKMKGSKIIEFIPALEKITIYDSDAGAKTEFYKRYKVAVKTPYMAVTLPKIYKIQNPDLQDTITVNGIVCKKIDEQKVEMNGQSMIIPVSYVSAYWENLCVQSNINEQSITIIENVTHIIEEQIPDIIFEIPSKYKFVTYADVVELQMKDKKGISSSYKTGDPIPTDFWNFK